MATPSVRPAMRVGLIVDHPKRDLGGTSLVARELAMRGAEAFLVPMYDQGVDIPRLGLDALVINYARPANRTLVETYAAAGIKVFVLDTEGGVLAERGGNSPPTLARSIRDNGYAALLSGYFFWGHELRDAFIHANTMPSVQLHVTGCPRFDFAAPRLRPFLARDPAGYVLVNANFPLVNPRFSGSQGGERAAMVAAGWPPDYVDRLLTDLRLIFPRYLETVRQFAGAAPDRSVLVRPHPFENQQPYQEAFAGLPNVRIDGTGSVLEAIYNASAVVHLNCGTAIEAVMLGKLPLHMQFLDTPFTANHAKLPARVSRPVGSAEELDKVLRDLPGETARFDFARVHTEYIYPYFHHNDGKAADRVAAILMQQGADRGGSKLGLSAMLSSSRPRPSVGQFTNGLASAALGSAATSTLRAVLDPKRRDKMISPPSVVLALGPLANGNLRITHAKGGLLGRLASLRVKSN
jgi:surface carbohydrate biosynthesis protein